MSGWVLFAFLIGLLAGAAGMWALLAWFGNQPEPTPQASPRAPRPLAHLGGGEDAPDSMSQTAQRLLSDLERKFEGTVSSEAEAAPTPRRRRTRKAGPSTSREPD